MHVVYLPEENWNEFFQQQVGGGHYFEGVSYRRGNQQGGGLGAAFAAFMRFLIPIAKQVAPHLAAEGFSLGSRLMGQLSEGQPLKQTFKKESKQSLKNLVSKANANFQQGNGRRRRKIPNLSHSLVGKRLRADAPQISSHKYLDPFDEQ